MQVRFGENVCHNERIRFRRGRGSANDGIVKSRFFSKNKTFISYGEQRTCTSSTKETSIASLLGLSNNVTLDIQTLRVVTLSTNSKGRKVCMNGMTDNVSLVTTIPEIFVQNSFCLLMTIRFTVMYCVPCFSAITTVKFVTLYSTFVRILKAFHAPGAVIQQFEYHQTHNGNPRPNQRLDRGSFGKDLNQNYRCDMRLYGERFLDER